MMGLNRYNTDFLKLGKERFPHPLLGEKYALVTERDWMRNERRDMYILYEFPTFAH